MQMKQTMLSSVMSRMRESTVYFSSRYWFRYLEDRNYSHGKFIIYSIVYNWKLYKIVKIIDLKFKIYL